MKIAINNSFVRTINKNQPGHFNFFKNQISLIILIIATLTVFLVRKLTILRQEYPLQGNNASESFLTPFLGCKRDSHDMQWESFRGNLFTLFGFMACWKILYQKINFFKQPSAMMLFGAGFTLFSYRADFLFYFGFILIWYLFTKYFHKRNNIVIVCWIISVLILFFNEKYNHLRSWSAWLQNYVPFQFMKNRNAPILWTNMLNMTLLKLLSFTIDCHRGDQKKQYQKHRQKCQSQQLCYQCRDLFPLPQISFINFCQYIFFAPTFFAGPPIAYKNFHSFQNNSTNKKPNYLKCLVLLISFQLWHHFVHSVRPCSSMSLLQIWDLSLFNLMFIWFKFNVIWKITRLWSLMMGVDVIDNMGRCVLNNYGFQRFWRMWHKGFNHWLLRYLYIPCGGNRTSVSTIVVITFVAFWHDHTVNILIWGFILALFMVPEFAIKNYFRKHYPHLYPKEWFKYLCAFICSFYIQVLCICNLIGFGYTMSQTNTIFSALNQSFLQLIFIQFYLTSLAIFQFYIRELDGRKD